MPIYEYECRSCKHQFEALVRTGHEPSCPACASIDLERRISLFAVDSADGRQRSLAAARQKNSKLVKDKRMADHEYEQKHLDDH
jgi:putative FmdB family regulatory protein